MVSPVLCCGLCLQGLTLTLWWRRKADIHFYKWVCSGQLYHFAFSDRMMVSRCNLQLNLVSIHSESLVYLTFTKSDFVRARNMPICSVLSIHIFFLSLSDITWVPLFLYTSTDNVILGNTVTFTHQLQFQSCQNPKTLVLNECAGFKIIGELPFMRTTLVAQ
jgi:hypothetical protein